MNNMNSGYVGYSMSRRAAEAYDDGEMPLSKAATALKQMILAEFGAKITIKEARAMLESNGYSSWHHTSKFCNKTYFYSPQDVIDEIHAEIGEIAEHNQKPVQTIDWVRNLVKDNIMFGHEVAPIFWQIMVRRNFTQKRWNERRANREKFACIFGLKSNKEFLTEVKNFKKSLKSQFKRDKMATEIATKYGISPDLLNFSRTYQILGV